MDLELSAVASSLESADSAGDGYVIVALRGECDIVNSDVLRERLLDLLDLLDGQAPCLILDLSGLAFIDASGITALVVAGQRARERGVTLLLAAARTVVARVVHLTELDRSFPVYATVAEAVAAVAADAVDAADAADASGPASAGAHDG